MRTLSAQTLIWFVAGAIAASLAGHAHAQGSGAPPRSSADITKALEFYKPDPAAAARAREAIARQPPQTSDQAQLSSFYAERGRAAGRLGNVAQQIADLRRAREHIAAGAPEAVSILRELATAEMTGGNLLEALRLFEESNRVVPANQSGLLIAGEAGRATAAVRLGDFPLARQALGRAEAVYARVQKLPSAERFGHTWAMFIERARGEVSFLQGRMTEAEAAFRKAIAEVEQDAQLRDKRAAAGDASMIREAADGYRSYFQRRLAQTLVWLGRHSEA